MQNRISILASDQDNIKVNGVGWKLNNIDSACRFNGYFSNNSPANSDQCKYTRYFTKGGLYKAKLVYFTFTDGALVDIGLDSNSTKIFSQVDFYSASANRNVVKEITLEISRGYHDITFLANGKNGSSSGYQIRIMTLELDLIQEYPVYQDDRPAQINQGSMVSLGKHSAIIAESTFTFNFADLDMLNKYSEIIIDIDGAATASLALQLLVNAIATGYYADGFKDLVGTLTGVNFSNTAQHEILGTNIIDSAQTFKARIILSLSGTTLSIISDGGVAAKGMTKLQGAVGISASNITSIQLKTSTSTWTTATKITINGIRKQ